MKLVKISLVAAVAVASLSTASFADDMMSGVKITGKTDFRWKTEMDDNKDGLSKGKYSGFVRDRVDLDFVAKSSDGKGKVHFRTRYQSLGHKDISKPSSAVAAAGSVTVNKAYATYKMMGMTVGFGPKIGSPGKFSFSTNSGATLTKKVGAIAVKVGAFDNGDKADKQIVAVTGKAGPANFALDFGMGDEADMANNYIATLAHIKVGPAKLGLGYAKGLSKPAIGDDDRSIFGLSGSMSMAGLNLGAGYTMAGDGKALGEKSTVKDILGANAIVEKNAGTGLPKELGYAYGSLTPKTDTFYVHASKKIAGMTLGGFYSSADVNGKITLKYIQAKIVKKFNAQSKLTAFYHNKDFDGKVVTNSVELRFSSKI